jgi:hypothetical protein
MKHATKDFGRLYSAEADALPYSPAGSEIVAKETGSRPSLQYFHI